MTQYLFSILFLLSSTFALAQSSFYDKADTFFDTYVSAGKVNYQTLHKNQAIDPFVKMIESADLQSMSGNDKKAFLINAYNFLVIDQALKNYPLTSVLDVPNFFDTKTIIVAGEKMSLNELEKGTLFKEFPDGRLHFVLVCGAVDCPPIINKAYRPNILEEQLETQTRKALNDPQFIRVNTTQIELSQIFEWYASDFGGSKKNVLEYINTYRSNSLPEAAKVSYYNYDWTLNIGGQATGELRMKTDYPATTAQGIIPTAAANSARYIVSSTIPQGTYEIKIFNNLYSQEVTNERATFFTSTLSALYGLNSRINVGFDARYRRVRYDPFGAVSNFAVLSSPNENSAFRQGITGIGPKVRIAPFGKLPNFSIQSTYLISTKEDAAGRLDGNRFIDFEGDTWITQFFNDFALGTRFSAFTEIDLIIEDIGSAEGRINRVSTPATGIFSFFPTPMSTLYVLGSYSPFWQENFDYFTQIGAGAKYQFNPNFELEFLITQFSNPFISDNEGSASTVNLGIRFNL